MPVKRAPRRTQAARREGTIRKLFDATASALIEVGYSGASVQEICARAGVSHGGLFRHFASREDLMVAVAADLGRQILDGYHKKFDARAPDRDPLVVALELLRATCGSRPNQAWYELAIAARTNPRLRKALAPLSAEYYRAIGALARQLLPDLVASFGDRFDLLLDTVIAIFDGEQMHRFLTRQPDLEAGRIALLVELVSALR
jgi:AcrR family transcriptional regulator